LTKHASDTAAMFSRQAEAYAASETHAAGDDLETLAAFAAAEPDERALDIATGPGHTALRIAQSAGWVVAADMAPGMLATARRLSRERGRDNLRFVQADAGALPFAAGSFDLVTCRIAPHHFADVPGFLADVARVLAPTGRLVLEDSLGPEDAELAAFLDHVERRRDPTHVHRLTEAEWRDALSGAGLAVTRQATVRKRHDFAAWVGRVGLDEAGAAAVAADILAAPQRLRAPLFEAEAGCVIALHDEKIILRAELNAGP
jgi:ubiquinone/menaquinone biosynthesis C-methylase UbiE